MLTDCSKPSAGTLLVGTGGRGSAGSRPRERRRGHFLPATLTYRNALHSKFFGAGLQSGCNEE